MASNHKGTAVVLMGVSGAGKSTIGEMLARALNCSFIDADDFHPQSNKEKMKNGVPLSDEDRIPWLESLRDAVGAALAGGETVVLGCSALRKHHRDILRSADPAHRAGSYDACAVRFVLLDVDPELVLARLRKRAAEGTHFMPPELLRSQVELLRVEADEGILKVDASKSPRDVVDVIRASLFRSGV